MNATVSTPRQVTKHTDQALRELHAELGRLYSSVLFPEAGSLGLQAERQKIRDFLGKIKEAARKLDHSVGTIDAAMKLELQEQRVMVMEIIRRLCKNSSNGFAHDYEIIREALALGMNQSQTVEVLGALRRNNSIYQKGGPGTYAPLGPVDLET